ncbi:MAG: methylated-DNA--[protein]-cysteine S-methyltransferase [Acidimicrobiia bacterium]
MTKNLDIEDALRDLRVPAPPGFGLRALTATGIVDAWTTVDGPSGPLYVAHNPEGISGVAPAVSPEAFGEIHSRRSGRMLGNEEALPPRLATALERTFTTGKLAGLRVDLRELTEFQQAVLRKTAEIPPGEIRPYGWVAREIGKPGAVRAVGSALNRNPVPVVIPCHRVARSDGAVGEYAFGAAMKRALLAGEGTDLDHVDQLASSGVRFTGAASTRIYCHPTCRHGLRIGTGQVVSFRSATDAALAGYRPCKVCRPAAA